MTAFSVLYTFGAAHTHSATAAGVEPSWLQLVGGAVVMAGIAPLQLRQMRRVSR